MRLSTSRYYVDIIFVCSELLSRNLQMYFFLHNPQNLFELHCEEILSMPHNCEDIL
jgi:hypothetical protein